MIKVLTGIVVMSALISCSGRKVVDTGAAVATKSAVLTVQANGLKDKGKKYDVDFSMINESEKTVIVLLADMGCYKGNVQGTLQHAFFGAGERTIDLTSKQKKNFHLVCKLGSKVESGEYKVVVRRVYENLSNDRKTTGKEIAKDIEWKLANTEKR